MTRSVGKFLTATALMCLLGCVGLLQPCRAASDGESGPERAAARGAPVDDSILYGEEREPAVAEYLRAGPISLKFQDGELRYLHVGDREIVRRVYFGVRDTRYDTVMPKFSKVDVQKGRESFKITLQAACSNDLIGRYSWQALIEGTAEGRISFAVAGKAEGDCQSPRIGLNVLYGVESLAGQRFEVVDESGAVTKGEFPRLVARSHLTGPYRTLRYTGADGVRVITSLAEQDFGMEDQRMWGDSSYKAFSAVPHGYTNMAKGEEGGQELTIEVENAAAAVRAARTVSITVGSAVEGARMPRLLPPEESGESQHFTRYNGDPKKYASAEIVTMPYNPAAHMPDDDNLMENIPVIRDQVETIRSFAPQARFRIDPITIDSPYPRPGPDPRNKGLFAAAWCARMVKYLALARVDEAVFKVGPAYAELLLGMMAPYAGRQVLATSVGPHEALDALAIDDGGRRVIWVINKTDRPQRTALDGVAGEARLHVVRLNASTSLQSGLGAPEELAAKDGSVALTLGPFEVCMVSEAE